MAENPHFKELLQLLNAAGAEYLIVGGYAVMKYSEPRFTKDLDLWVGSSPANAAKVYQALAQFGAPLSDDGITPDTFSQQDVVYQIGLAPVRIDILTHVTGVRFDDAWPKRIAGMLFGEAVHFISRDDLIANKQAIGRDADAEQIKQLRKHRG